MPRHFLFAFLFFLLGLVLSSLEAPGVQRPEGVVLGIIDAPDTLSSRPTGHDLIPTASATQQEPPIKRDDTIVTPTETLSAGVDDGSDGGGGGLTKDQKIALGVGIPSVLLAAAAVFFAWRGLRRN
jgi:hypothetical protein